MPTQDALPKTMTAAFNRSYGNAEAVEIGELPLPAPSRKQVLVQVKASSLNALDWHFLTGTPYLIRAMSGLRKPKELVRGADVAGVVVGAGAEVTDFALGDTVFGEAKGGGCSAYLTVDAKHVAHLPDGVSFESAGATPVAGLTALQGLRTHADLQPGEQVLVNGAAGGVGTFAVQIAKALGAEVTAICSTRNVDMVRSLGADTVIDYTSEDFVEGGARFDILLDNVGNRDPSECVDVLKSSGRYVAVSGPKTNRWLGPMPYIARAALHFRRAEQTLLQFTASPNHDDLTFLGELLASEQVVPEIQRVVGLDGVADALAEIGSGHTRAKIVVLPRLGPRNIAANLCGS